MNKIFRQYYDKNDARKPSPEINLQLIARNLNLGYSTILHKFK